MPWDCTGCGTTAVLDDEPACPGCGGAKAAWTMHVDRTRTFRTSRKEKLELLRGTDERAVEQAVGHAADVELVAAKHAVSLPKATARRLMARRLLPAPAHVLVLRLHPRAGQDPAAQTAVLFETTEVVPQDHPREPLVEPGALDLWFVLVHGAEDAADLAFPGLTVLDVTEAALPAGHAPQLGASGLGAKRRDLPIETLLAAHVHARLLRAPDGSPVGPADLAWEKDGAAVTQGELGPGVVLPAGLAEDGVIQAEDLPWGTYRVTATLRSADPALDGRELEAATLPLLAERDAAPHDQWVRLGPRRGHLHARLVHPLGFPLRRADLAWEKDGAAVTAADLGPGATLPAEVGDDGVLRADGLPWGRYTCLATLRTPPPGIGGRPLARVALPLLRRADEAPHLQRLRFAAPRELSPVDEGTRGAVHAKLLLDPDGAPVEEATLAWETDGPPIDGLPSEVGDGGLIHADGLAWGSYVVRATLPDGTRTLPAALPLLAEPGEEPHLQWVRRDGGRS